MNTKPLAVAIILSALLGAWMFRYEEHIGSISHRNRLTGVVCLMTEECWFHSNEMFRNETKLTDFERNQIEQDTARIYRQIFRNRTGL